MAASCYRVTDKAHGTSSQSLEDESLLIQPAIQAVQSFGCFSQQQLLQAARKVQAEKGTLSAGDLLQALDDLSLPKEQPVKSTLSHHKEHFQDLGSDGEESNSLPFYADGASADPQMKDCGLGDDDLEADGEAAALPTTNVFAQIHASVQEPLVKGKDRNSNEPDIRELKKKLRYLKSENRNLKERSLCKRCHSKPVSITFLPCGHYSYCYDCGQTFNACPICKKTILADVKTFLA